MYHIYIMFNEELEPHAKIGLIYYHLPEGQGLHKAAKPPGRDETRSVNPLVRTQVD